MFEPSDENSNYFLFQCLQKFGTPDGGIHLCSLPSRYAHGSRNEQLISAAYRPIHSTLCD